MGIPNTNTSKISIHALLAESDCFFLGDGAVHQIFLSTLSLRRATPKGHIHYMGVYISIHALLAESDLLPQPTPRPQPNFYPRSPCGERLAGGAANGGTCCDFYPRSPCGERPGAKSHDPGKILFLSTLSLRRATYGALKHVHEEEISIHALLAESDRQQINDEITAREFLSTLSLRRATSLLTGLLVAL